jgi:hypothetical protein
MVNKELKPVKHSRETYIKRRGIWKTGARLLSFRTTVRILAPISIVNLFEESAVGLLDAELYRVADKKKAITNHEITRNTTKKTVIAFLCCFVWLRGSFRFHFFLQLSIRFRL